MRQENLINDHPTRTLKIKWQNNILEKKEETNTVFKTIAHDIFQILPRG
jgi:ABC-type dipeptide/oligopeptide/nickel transport system ATPase component